MNYKGNLLKTQPQTRFETAPCAGPCAGLARALRGVLRGRFCPAGPGSALKNLSEKQPHLEGVLKNHVRDIIGAHITLRL